MLYGFPAQRNVPPPLTDGGFYAKHFNSNPKMNNFSNFNNFQNRQNGNMGLLSLANTQINRMKENSSQQNYSRGISQTAEFYDRNPVQGYNRGLANSFEVTRENDRNRNSFGNSECLFFYFLKGLGPVEF